MQTEVPQSVQQLLDEYIARVQQTVPGLVVGCYLHGSVALNAFTPGMSDIDFIAITSRRCTLSDIQTLHQLHHSLSRRFPYSTLEGSYLQWQDLGESQTTIPPHPYIHDGVLHPHGYHDINDVTWWVLKHHGIAVLGPSPEQLEFAIDWNKLIAAMHHNMNTYWTRFTTDPRRIAWLFSDCGVQWAVLGVLRQFYSFREHAITSKVGAGIYALNYTPAQWHRLIREAINIRQGFVRSAYRSRIVRALSARAFLQLIVTACDVGRTGHTARFS